MIKELKDCFDSKGNFIIPNFDPYRVKHTPEEIELYNYLFNNDGSTSKNITELIKENHYDCFSDAVKYYYAGEIDCVCSGHYNAVYLWRYKK